MSPMTGEEMVVTRRRMAAMKRKATPTLWGLSAINEEGEMRDRLTSGEVKYEPFLQCKAGRC